MSVTASSGNVFADLGVPQPGIALAKADLAIRLSDALHARELSVTAAAKVLNLTPTKVSDLIRGKLTGFSLDRLLTLLNRLDLDVEITVRPGRNTQSPAGTRVVG